MATRPQIKFYKDVTPDILAGRKTLEPRPRSHAWIERIEKAGIVDLTYGPRMGAPTIFATARIVNIEIKPFTETTRADLDKIGYGWSKRTIKEFIKEYTKWYTKDLEKGYPVAWIEFQLISNEGADANHDTEAGD